jgi:hypothetical protein
MADPSKQTSPTPGAGDDDGGMMGGLTSPSRARAASQAANSRPNIGSALTQAPPKIATPLRPSPAQPQSQNIMPNIAIQGNQVPYQGDNVMAYRDVIIPRVGYTVGAVINMREDGIPPATRARIYDAVLDGLSLYSFETATLLTAVTNFIHQDSAALQTRGGPANFMSSHPTVQQIKGWQTAKAKDLVACHRAVRDKWGEDIAVFLKTQNPSLWASSDVLGGLRYISARCGLQYTVRFVNWVMYKRLHETGRGQIKTPTITGGDFRKFWDALRTLQQEYDVYRKRQSQEPAALSLPANAQGAKLFEEKMKAAGIVPDDAILVPWMASNEYNIVYIRPANIYFLCQ